MPAVRIRELAGAVAAGARTFDLIDYADQGEALDRPAQRPRQRRADDPAGLLAPGARAATQPRVALIEDNTDNFVSATLAGSVSGMVGAFNAAGRPAPRIPAQAALDVVEVYPYVPYIQYLLPGSIMMSIFMMVMIGGGIIFIDDKARGLHEGYLVTPITKLELIAGFNISGTIKAVLAGIVLMIDRLADRRRAESARSDAHAAAAGRDHRHRRSR